jgi:hypothetical protein
MKPLWNAFKTAFVVLLIAGSIVYVPAYLVSGGNSATGIRFALNIGGACALIGGGIHLVFGWIFADKTRNY